MSEFKVGDRVVTATGHGVGKIVEIEDDDFPFPVVVNLDSGEGVLGFRDYELEAVK